MAQFVKLAPDALKTLRTVNPRLVRGLDYYRHTVFEFITESLGTQGTVLGGGRYDGLVQELGGSQTSGIGFGSGVDRLAMLLMETKLLPPATRPVAVVPAGEDAVLPVMKIAQDLRRAGCIVDMTYSGNMGKRLKKANKINACVAVIAGSDELSKGAVCVRDLDSGEQSEVLIKDLAGYLKKYGGERI